MTPARVNPETHEDEVLRWRNGRIERLTSDTGWLTLVGLFWLEEGENRFGAAESSAIVLPKAPATAGSLWLEGETVRLQANPDAGITSGGKPVTSMQLASDADGEPTVLDLGTLTFHVIQRAGRFALRVKDREHPARTSFPGIESYPIDAKYRVTARLEPYVPQKEIPIATVINTTEKMESPGALVFEIDGATHRLDPVLELGESDWFLIFADKTNGQQTYGAGRYVYAPPPGADGTTVIDFNKSYNPPCAFTPYATCPLPPPQNRLSIPIPAGEKKFGEH